MLLVISMYSDHALHHRLDRRSLMEYSDEVFLETCKVRHEFRVRQRAVLEGLGELCSELAYIRTWLDPQRVVVAMHTLSTARRWIARTFDSLSLSCCACKSVKAVATFLPSSITSCGKSARRANWRPAKNCLQ